MFFNVIAILMETLKETRINYGKRINKNRLFIILEKEL